VPIHDLVVKNGDLAVATHGRSFWVLDNVALLHQLDAQARAADVSLSADHGPGQPAVLADPQRIRQVLGNLLGNSFRHTPAGGRVTVSTRASADGATVIVEVTDTGSGISPDLLPRVFERFVKGEGFAGSGLGLAICRDIIRAHGGEISIVSAPERGTTVTFSLPAVESGG